MGNFILSILSGSICSHLHLVAENFSHFSFDFVTYGNEIEMDLPRLFSLSELGGT